MSVRHSRWRRSPRRPSFRSVFRGKFLVTLEVQISLLVSDREQIAELGTNAENARFESVEERRCANIVSNLLVGISDHADEELLGQKVRCTPVKVADFPVRRCLQSSGPQIHLQARQEAHIAWCTANTFLRNALRLAGGREFGPLARQLLSGLVFIVHAALTGLIN